MQALTNKPPKIPPTIAPASCPFDNDVPFPVPLPLCAATPEAELDAEEAEAEDEDETWTGRLYPHTETSVLAVSYQCLFFTERR